MIIIVIILSNSNVSWKKRNAIWHVKVKPKKTNLIKSQESSNCHEPLSQERINGRYQTFKQCYKVGLDPITRSYLVRWIKWSCNISGKILSNYITHRKKEPPDETLLWNAQKTLQTKASLMANQFHLL